MSSDGRVAIVVPCYNEAARFDVAAFDRYLGEPSDVDFIFVNDGSTDATSTVMQGLADRWSGRIVVIELCRNSGKAEAVRQGMVQAMSRPDTQYAGFWDADLATPLEAIKTFIDTMDRRSHVDLLLGARLALLGRSIDRKASRHYSGRLFATVASLVLDLPVYDTQCGAKIVRVNRVTRGLFQEPFGSRWIFDVELIARYLAHHPDGEGIYELPLDQWRDVGGSKVRAVDFVRAIGESLQIYHRYRAPRRQRRILDTLTAPFMQYAGVGMIGTIVHYLILSFGVELMGIRPAVSAGVGAICGGVANYLANYHFTFASTRSHCQTLPRFVAVALSGAVISGLIVQLATQRLGLHYLVGQVFATLLALGIGFVLNRSWTFAQAFPEEGSVLPKERVLLKATPAPADSDSHGTH